MPRELQGNKNVNPSQVIIERDFANGLQKNYKTTTAMSENISLPD